MWNNQNLNKKNHILESQPDNSQVYTGWGNSRQLDRQKGVIPGKRYSSCSGRDAEPAEVEEVEDGG